MSILVMSLVWSNGPVAPNERLMLLALADNANDSGIAWPAVGTLARKCGVQSRAAQRTLAALSEAGWVTIEERPGRSNYYRLNMARLMVTPVVHDTPVVDDTPVVHDTPTPVVDDTPPLSSTTPEPSLNRQVNRHSPQPPEREAPMGGVQGPPSMWRRLFTAWPDSRRGGWTSAQQQYRGLVESGWDEEKIHAAAAAYLADARGNGTDERFIKMLANFLREPEVVAQWLPEDEHVAAQRIEDETVREYIDKGWTQDPETGRWSMPKVEGF